MESNINASELIVVLIENLVGSYISSVAYTVFNWERSFSSFGWGIASGEDFENRNMLLRIFTSAREPYPGRHVFTTQMSWKPYARSVQQKAKSVNGQSRNLDRSMRIQKKNALKIHLWFECYIFFQGHAQYCFLVKFNFTLHKWIFLFCLMFINAIFSIFCRYFCRLLLFVDQAHSNKEMNSTAEKFRR